MGDPVLTTMGVKAGDFIRDIKAKRPRRWLTFWGNPGTGKTFLARKIHEMYPKRSHWLDWVKLCGRYQAKEDVSGRVSWAVDAKLLVIDDIGAEHMTEATVGMLHRLLQMRLGQWTVITSNHSPDRWREIDARIASRIIRDRNIHVDCTTLDFATRPNVPRNQL